MNRGPPANLSLGWLRGNVRVLRREPLSFTPPQPRHFDEGKAEVEKSASSPNHHDGWRSPVPLILMTLLADIP